MLPLSVNKEVQLSRMLLWIEVLEISVKNDTEEMVMLRSNSQEGCLDPVRCLLSNEVKSWITEVGSDYLYFWRDKRTACGYFKLGDILLGGVEEGG
jgi:hypothetical protein